MGASEILRAIAFLALASATSPGSAQSAADKMEVRSWTLADRDLHVERDSSAAYRLRLEMAVVSGSRWTPAVILDAAKAAVPLLAQCGIRATAVTLHEFDAPQRYRYLSTRDSREFARRAGLQKPTVFFVDDTRQQPAFDAEAIGRGNASSRPEMADSVWITWGIQDLPIALAHELVHVLSDSGEHSDAPANLMREDTAPENVQLTPAQCSRIVTTARRNGLLEDGDAPPGGRSLKSGAPAPHTR